MLVKKVQVVTFRRAAYTTVAPHNSTTTINIAMVHSFIVCLLTEQCMANAYYMATHSRMKSVPPKLREIKGRGVFRKLTAQLYSKNLLTESK